MARACGLVFLINKLGSQNQELGIKATVDTLADLLVENLSQGSGALRSKLPGLLEKCELLMPTLDKTLRARLERTVREARSIAENAARAALGQLGVDEQVVPTHLNEAQRELRRKLRAHGRQLGDALNGDKVQNMSHKNDQARL